jgi:hypothetical protein
MTLSQKQEQLLNYLEILPLPFTVRIADIANVAGYKVNNSGRSSGALGALKRLSRLGLIEYSKDEKCGEYTIERIFEEDPQNKAKEALQKNIWEMTNVLIELKNLSTTAFSEVGNMLVHIENTIVAKGITKSIDTLFGIREESRKIEKFLSNISNIISTVEAERMLSEAEIIPSEHEYEASQFSY